MEYLRHVAGKESGRIVLYALSTCVWCRMTKRLLESLGVAYSYVDVDLLDSETAAAVGREISRWNPRQSYPTLVIDERECVLGYDEQKIRQAVADGR